VIKILQSSANCIQLLKISCDVRMEKIMEIGWQETKSWR